MERYNQQVQRGEYTVVIRALYHRRLKLRLPDRLSEGMMLLMRVILGIGNPGAEYVRTRHNCGFMVVDELAERHRLEGWSKRWSAMVCEWSLPESLGGQRALLVKPLTYVNLSGESAQAILAFYKVPPSDLLVIVDDINLPLGHLRLRGDGSAGGHNGLKDIEARLGKQYPRLRLGIGRPVHDQIDHVLSAFSQAEQPEVQAMISRGVDCVEGWLQDGLTTACRYNGPARAISQQKSPAASHRVNSGVIKGQPTETGQASLTGTDQKSDGCVLNPTSEDLSSGDS
jgi:peptidyl-tRNA hydrolase, PTH1 family